VKIALFIDLKLAFDALVSTSALEQFLPVLTHRAPATGHPLQSNRHCDLGLSGEACPNTPFRGNHTGCSEQP
jgi:hypothetical protein